MLQAPNSQAIQHDHDHTTISGLHSPSPVHTARRGGGGGGGGAANVSGEASTCSPDSVSDAGTLASGFQSINNNTNANTATNKKSSNGNGNAIGKAPQKTPRTARGAVVAEEKAEEAHSCISYMVSSADKLVFSFITIFYLIFKSAEFNLTSIIRLIIGKLLFAIIFFILRFLLFPLFASLNEFFSPHNAC
jgi:hypothetical protein